MADVLDRIAHHLGDPAMWETPAADGQFRLLAAAADESRHHDSGNRGSDTQDDHNRQDRVINLGQRRRARHRRSGLLGAGAAVAVAAAAVVVVMTIGPLGNRPAEIGSEAAISATYILHATELDPDTVATVDVVPTPAGVKLQLHLEGLDNRYGPHYYSAWLAGSGEMIPLGSFHWREGGVEIELWSGVDDPTYNQLVVTRQTQGDRGVPSDQIVLSGLVPDLTPGQ